MADQIRRKRRRTSHVTTDGFVWDEPVAGKRRRKRSKHRFLGWFAILLLVGLALPIIWWIRETDEESLLFAEPDVPVRDHSIKDAPPPPASPDEKSQAATSALLGFVNDPSHETRANRIFEKANALENLVQYYDSRKNTLPRRIINPSVSALNLRDRELLLVSFTDQDGRQWSAPFEWKGDSYLLHWEAMVGFGEISWNEFFDNRPKGHFVMRANFFVPEKDTFSPLTADRMVILMSHPDLAKAANVEVRVGSEVHQQLMDFPRLTDIPAMVDLYWPEGENGMPMVSRWLQRDWIKR